jgi:hypothetical protein
MPIAAVDKNHHLRAGECEVGSPARHAWNRLVDAVTETTKMQLPSEPEFRLGIAARVRGHALGHRWRARWRSIFAAHLNSPKSFSLAQPFRPALEELRTTPLLIVILASDDRTDSAGMRRR